MRLNLALWWGLAFLAGSLAGCSISRDLSPERFGCEGSDCADAAVSIDTGMIDTGVVESDAGRPDSGGLVSKTCTLANPCDCQSSDNTPDACLLSCTNGPCMMTCGVGAVCEIDCGTSSCSVTCQNGATCDVTCGGLADCFVTCGIGGVCRVNATDTSDAILCCGAAPSECTCTEDNAATTCETGGRLC